MDKDNSSSITKKNFINLFTQLTKICKDTNEEINKNYQKGRKDAIEEVIQWFNSNYSNDKYVSANSLALFLQSQINQTKNQMNTSENNNINDIKPIFDINEIKRNYNSNDINA